jgi:hypothetical protein
MTLIDPLSRLPEYEIRGNGCEMRARWPGLVAAARSSSPTSKRRAFYEFAPVPGGHFLVGVGHEPGGSDEPSFLREQILGQLEAGHELGESVCNVSRTWGSQDQQSGICYALFDPDQPTLQMSGSGTQISAIQVTVNSTRLVRARRTGEPAKALRAVA